MPLTHTRTEAFEVDNDLTLAAELRSAGLTVAAVPDLLRVQLTIQATGTRAEEVADSVIVISGHGRINVEVPSLARFLGAATSLRLHAEVPEGTNLQIASGSGSIEAVGAYGLVETRAGSGSVRIAHAARTELTTASGSIRLIRAERAVLQSGSGSIEAEEAAEMRASAGSGSITVEAVTGSCEAGAGSGRITIRRLSGTGKVETRSGSVRLGEVEGDVEASAGSGSVTIDRLLGGRLVTSTASGSQRIGVAEGTAVQVDASSVSGRVTSELGSLDDVSGFARTAVAQVRSISGGITFSRT